MGRQLGDALAGDRQGPTAHGDLEVGVIAQDAPIVVFYYPDGIYAYRPSAYDGWISDRGMGIFTKRSFLPGYTSTYSSAG